MAKYRRMPGNPVECVQFAAHDPTKFPMVGIDPIYGPFVTTIHLERAYVEDGDWILPEPDGEHYYPCKPDVFAATYERVQEGRSMQVVDDQSDLSDLSDLQALLGHKAHES